MKEMYHVELIWNREFDFVPFIGSHFGPGGSPHNVGSYDTIEKAIAAAESIQNSGDGARVKKTRVVSSEDKVVWAYGKMVKNT